MPTNHLTQSATNINYDMGDEALDAEEFEIPSSRARKPGTTSDTALQTLQAKEIILSAYEKRAKHYQSAPRTFTYDKLVNTRIKTTSLHSSLSKFKSKVSSGHSVKSTISKVETAASGPDRYVTTSYSESLDKMLNAIPVLPRMLSPESRQEAAQKRLSVLREEPHLSLPRPTSQVYSDKSQYDDQTPNSVLDDLQFIQYTSQDIQYTPKIKAAKVVGRYVMGDALGEGSYGKVKEGYCIETLKRVAIKIMKQARLKKIPNGEANVKREISLLKRLRNKNVVELMDVIYNTEKHKIYVVFEFCAATLTDILARAPDGKLPLSQCQRYFRQLIKGLRYLHSNSVIHRDIKPGNLLVTIDDTIKISDFGVAEEIPRFSPTDKLVTSSGSPAFQPPEIASGKDSYFGAKVDIWAAGVTLYHLVSGRYPFDGETIYALFDCIAQGVYIMPSEADDLLADLIKNVLNADAEKRYNVDQILSHLWLLSQLPQSPYEVPVVAYVDPLSSEPLSQQPSGSVIMEESHSGSMVNLSGGPSGSSHRTPSSTLAQSRTIPDNFAISNPNFAYDTTLIPYLEMMFDDMPQTLRRSSMVDRLRIDKKCNDVRKSAIAERFIRRLSKPIISSSPEQSTKRATKRQASQLSNLSTSNGSTKAPSKVSSAANNFAAREDSDKPCRIQ